MFVVMIDSTQSPCDANASDGRGGLRGPETEAVEADTP